MTTCSTCSTMQDMQNEKRTLSLGLMADSWPLLILVTAAGGFSASYSFLARGGVFAFAQTGNIIYSGHVLASGRFWQIISFLLPALSYMLGLLAARQLERRLEDKIRFQKRILLLESFLLLLTSQLPASLDPHDSDFPLPHGLRQRTPDGDFPPSGGPGIHQHHGHGEHETDGGSLRFLSGRPPARFPQESPGLYPHQWHLLPGLSLGLRTDPGPGRYSHPPASPFPGPGCLASPARIEGIKKGLSPMQQPLQLTYSITQHPCCDRISAASWKEPTSHTYRLRST